MARSAASYGAAVLHAPQVRFIYSPFQTWHGVAKRRRLKHCFRLHFITPRQAISFRYETFSVITPNMKHSLRSYDEKMKNVSLSVCNTTLSALYYHRKGIT